MTTLSCVALFTVFPPTVCFRRPSGESFDYTYDTLHQVTKAEKTVNGVTQAADYTYDRYGNTESVTLSASGSDLKITSSAVYSDF